MKLKLGAPVLFKQPRPGKNEKIFQMYKFRSMSNQKDEMGQVLSDKKRMRYRRYTFIWGYLKKLRVN